MKIGIPALLVALVILSTGTMGTVGPDTLPADSERELVDSAPKEITECTTITEPGRYVVMQEIPEEPDSESPCIHVKASDVVIDGQGYEIDVAYDATAISVGADDHRLSNVTVKSVEISGLHFGSPIKYRSVDGGTVANVILLSNVQGLLVVNSRGISVRENTIEAGSGPTMFPPSHGVKVINSSDTVITANTLLPMSQPGVFYLTPTPLQVERSTNTTIANNNITSLHIDKSASITIANNNMTSLTLASGTSNTVIVQNNISATQEPAYGGVRVATNTPWHTANGMTVIENNTIMENEVGVFIETHNGTLKIQNNELVGNDYGVRRCQLRNDTPPAITGTEEVEIQHNVIANNSEYGILNEEPVTLTATHNYWGAPSGPSSTNDSDAPFEDPVTGTPADGEGDAVSENPNASGISNVHFDPWLNQSVTNASVDGAN